jgi:hypothetical protein
MPPLLESLLLVLGLAYLGVVLALLLEDLFGPVGDDDLDLDPDADAPRDPTQPEDRP